MVVSENNCPCRCSCPRLQLFSAPRQPRLHSQLRRPMPGRTFCAHSPPLFSLFCLPSPLYTGRLSLTRTITAAGTHSPFLFPLFCLPSPLLYWAPFSDSDNHSGSNLHNHVPVCGMPALFSPLVYRLTFLYTLPFPDNSCDDVPGFGCSFSPILGD